MLGAIRERTRVINQVLRRSHRLYYWTPCEADAKSMIGVAIRQMKKTPEDVAAVAKIMTDLRGSL